MDIITYALLKKNIKGMWYKGEYMEGVGYVEGDVVTSGSSIYYCRKDTSNPAPSGEWILMLTVDDLEGNIEEEFNKLNKKVDEKLTEVDENIAKTLEFFKKELNELSKDIVQTNKDVSNFLKSNVHMGKYDSNTTYVKGNEVEYYGSTYRALITSENVEPTEESNWVLIAQRGVDGDGSVKSVNNLTPDLGGNIDLGKLVKSVNDKVADEKGNIALGDLATPTDVNKSKVEAVTEAKEYTDTHSNKTNNPHKVTKSQVELGNVQNYGIATQKEAEVGMSNAKYMTPKTTSDAIASHGKGQVYYDNTIKTDTPWSAFPNGVNVYTLVESGDVEDNDWRKLLDLTTTGAQISVQVVKMESNPYRGYQLITGGYNWSGGTTTINAVAIRKFETDKHEPITTMIVTDRNLSNSTTSNSSDTVATSKAVYDLQQQVNDLRNAIIEIGGKL